MNHRPTTPVADAAVCCLLLALVAGSWLTFVDPSVPPADDAAMLLRYATHLGEGHGVVWNVGEQPVDGATDFLFMVCLAVLHVVGLSIETAARALTLTAHALTVLLLYVTNRRLAGAGIGPAALSATVLVAGPGQYYAAAYFGTPVFAFVACVAWALTLRVATSRYRAPHALAVAGCCLAAGLVRPEGVILAVLMQGSILALSGWTHARKALVWFVVVFAVLGGLYFAWRWSYFGYPLPNPFYRKGGGQLYPDSFVKSVSNVVRLCLPVLLALPLGLRCRASRRWLAALAIPIAGFAAAFVLLSDEMNVGSRFQYVVLPMLLMAWYPAVRGIWRGLGMPAFRALARPLRSALAVFAAGLVCAALAFEQKVGRFGVHHDGRASVAHELRRFKEAGYVLATSEAGLLPFYSGWVTVDAWGLNDQWIVHNGGVTEEYLDRYQPEVVMFHAWFTPLVPAPDGRVQRDPWHQTVLMLKEYAEKRGYVLAACYAPNLYDSHYYYVKSDGPDVEELVAAIRSVDYSWYGTGANVSNVALAQDPRPEAGGGGLEVRGESVQQRRNSISGPRPHVSALCGAPSHADKAPRGVSGAADLPAFRPSGGTGWRVRV